MNGDEFQKTVLEELEVNRKFQADTVEFQKDMTEFQKGMTEFQKNTLEFQKGMTEFQKNTLEFQKTAIDQLVRLTQEITEVKQEVAEVKQSQVRIENEHGEKIKALFDAQEVMMGKMERFNESQTRIEDKLDRLTLKVAAHDTILKRVN